MKIAIVTGASSVIGTEYVELIESSELFSDIGELWVISGQNRHLSDMSISYSKIKIVPMPLDLSEEMSLEFLKDMLRTKQPDVRFLINCAGICETGEFEAADASHISAVINLNVKAAVMVNRLCLPYMSAGACIITAGSLSSLLPVPMQAVYAPCEAFLSSHSFSLGSELKPKGINVLYLRMKTMKNEFDPNIMDMGNEPEKIKQDLRLIVEKSAVKALAGKSCYTPGAFPKLMAFLCRLLPFPAAVGLYGKLDR